MDEITDTEILDWIDANQAHCCRDIWCWTVSVPGWTEKGEPFKRTGNTLREATTAAIVADRGYRRAAAGKDG